MIDPAIFKAYDVRGLYGEEIDEDVAYRVGRAFPRVLVDEVGGEPAELRIGLGRDMRLQAPALAARYADGIRDAGADVLDVGRVGTEMLYYAVGSRELDGGLMCTASHNPAAYTGAKLVKRGAVALSGDSGMPELQRMVTEDSSLDEPPASPRGDYREERVDEEYRRKVTGFIDPDRVRPTRVVLDGGNGMAGPMVGPILDELPIEAVRLYWEPDGSSPTTSPTRCSRRTAAWSSTPCARRARTSASPGTGTPTAASSSTIEAGS